MRAGSGSSASPTRSWSRAKRLDELQAFLGVEPQPLRSWFEKLRTRPLSDVVENWEELRQGLTGTRYEVFLAESS